MGGIKTAVRLTEALERPEVARSLDGRSGGPQGQEWRISLKKSELLRFEVLIQSFWEEEDVAMMGERTVMQEALFYEFSLERHVPADHLLRSIDRFVDLSGIRAHLRPFYSEIGPPSIDPELMIRMLIVGYCFGIRSERRLCEEVHLNLAYRWFCRLGLEGDVPDHSTFSKNRHGRFRDSDLLRELFETTVRRCIAEGLVGGEGFAVDASLIKADANKQRSAEGSEEVDWEAMAATRRSVREYLDTLDEAAWGAASEVEAEVRLAVRSGGAMDRRAEGACLLRLRHQLPDRSRPRRHRRRRGEPRDPAGRGRRGPHHDRAHPGSLRALSGAAGRRQRLRLGRDARAGWSTSAGSSRTSRSSTSPSAATAPSSAPTSPTITTRSLHLPGRQGAEAAPEGLSDAAPSRR